MDNRLRCLCVAATAAIALAVLACGGETSGHAGGELFVIMREETSIPAGHDASQVGWSADMPGSALGFSHYVFEDIGGEMVATLVEGPRGAQVRSELSYEALKALRDSGGPVPPELAMSGEELATLVAQLEALREATEEYRHGIELAVRHGYVVTGGEVANMGLHLASPARIRDGKFDPRRPEMLLYARNGEGAWELVGAAFVLPTQLAGYAHPDGFAGPLDNWHVHYNLCTSASATFSSTKGACDAAGGEWAYSFGWMTHAYVWRESPLGVFNMWNPNVPPVARADAVAAARADGYPPSQGVSLFIEDFGFHAGRVRAGEQVVWTNLDMVAHTLSSGEREGQARDYGRLEPGESVSLTFEAAGEYRLSCALHPMMAGRVVVE